MNLNEYPEWTAADAAAMAGVKVGDTVYRASLSRHTVTPDCIGIVRPCTVIAANKLTITTVNVDDPQVTTWWRDSGMRLGRVYHGRLFARRPARFRDPVPKHVITDIAVTAMEQAA